MTSSRVITQAQALRWVESWGVADRDLITRVLSLLPPHELHQTKSYIAAKVDGKNALLIHHAWIEWPKGTWAPTVDEARIIGGLHTWGRTDGSVSAQLSNSPTW